MHSTPTVPSDYRPLILLRLPEVQRRTGKSKSDIYREVAAGSFPRPVQLSERARGWVEGEVNAWIAARVAERDGRSAA